MLKQINQIFTLKFISVLIISFPSAIVAEYLNIPLAWFLGPMIITSIAALSGLKIIKIKLNIILGIIIFRPDKAAIDVIIIGPKNQAKGILK